MRLLIRYLLFIAAEKELRYATTYTRLKRFEREIRQDNKGILGERKVVSGKICPKHMPFESDCGLLPIE